MSKNLKDLLTRSGLKMDEALALIQKTYPSIDKPLLSKCCNPDKYGASLDYALIESVIRQAAPEVWEKYKRHTDGHRNKRRIYIRVPDDLFDELTAAMKEDSFASFQEWGYAQILNYLLERRSNETDPG